MDRLLWKKNAFNAMLKGLILGGNAAQVSLDDAEEEHLVVVFGNTQVGKTSMILSMINLKDEYFDEVDRVLRAGIRAGNSSTSTAIIYSMSKYDDMYGYSYSGITGQISGEPEYCSGEELSGKLSEIRRKVENNEFSYKGNLNIMIPRRCFDSSEQGNIRIMDLPGIGSKNEDEQEHVRRLANFYIPMSSVCVIVCRASEIQQLESVTLPNEINWRDHPESFVVAVTFAYSEGDARDKILSYLKNNPAADSHAVLKYIKEEIYSKALKEIFSTEFKNKIYPIDVGTSFNKLCDNESLNADDVRRLKKVRADILSSLRSFVKKHEGDRLMPAVKKLMKSIDCSNQIKSIDAEIQKQNDEKMRNEDWCQRTDEWIQKLEGRQNILRSNIENLELLCNDRLPSLREYFAEFSLDSEIKDYVIKENLHKYKKQEMFLKSKNEYKEKIINLIDSLSDEKISSFAEKFCEIYSDAKDYISTNTPDIDVGCKLREAKSEYDFVQELSPDAKGFQKIFSPKVPFTQIERICEKLIAVLYIASDGLTSQLESVIDKAIQSKEAQDKKCTSSLSVYRKKVSKYTKNIENAENAKERLEAEKESIRKVNEKDKQVLNNAMSYVEEAFISQHNETVRQINQANSPEEKMMLLFELGIYEEDYRKIVGGSI